jgi:hypothetical protein
MITSKSVRDGRGTVATETWPVVAQRGWRLRNCFLDVSGLLVFNQVTDAREEID